MCVGWIHFFGVTLGGDVVLVGGETDWRADDKLTYICTQGGRGERAEEARKVDVRVVIGLEQMGVALRAKAVAGVGCVSIGAGSRPQRSFAYPPRSEGVGLGAVECHAAVWATARS